MSDPGFPLHDPPWTRMSLLGVPQVRHAGLLTALRRERPCAVAVRVAVGTPPQSAVVRVLLGVEPEVARRAEQGQHVGRGDGQRCRSGDSGLAA
jgi:hypothetical protein